MKFHSRVASLNSVCFDNVRSPVGHHHHCPCKQSFKFSFEKMGNSRSLYHLFSFFNHNFCIKSKLNRVFVVPSDVKYLHIPGLPK